MPGQILNRWLNGSTYHWDATYGRAPSASLWSTCPLQAIRSDPAYGQLYEQNFLGVTPGSNTIPGFTATQASAGTVTLDATEGLKFDTGDTTAGHGINLQMTRVNAIVATGKPVWLEARLKFTALTTLAIQFLFGLAPAVTTLITSNAVGTDDKLAFDGVPTTTGVIKSDATLSTTVNNGTGFTIVNNSYYKLGIYAQAGSVQYWVNNVVVSTLTTQIPIVALTPSSVVQGQGTVEPIVYMSWLRFASLY